MADYRNVWALIAAVGFLQIGGGILGIVTPLGLGLIGAGPLTIGLIAALHAAGYMIGAQFSTQLIRLFGNIRVYSAAATLAAVSVLVMQLSLDIVTWSLVRLLQGAAFLMMFASLESWLGAATPPKRRGSVSGMYHLIAKFALIIGPFFVAGQMATDFHAFTWCAIFLALSLIPVCLTRRGEPPAPDKAAVNIRNLYEMAPAAVMACFLAGVVNTGALSLLPIYAEMVLAATPEETTAAAAFAAAAVWGGALLSQWPAGRLSDHVDRRMIIAVMSGFSAVAAVALGFGRLLPDAVTYALLAVWGAGSLSYYGIAVAHAIDRAPSGQIAQVMAGLLFVWAAGSVVGPLMSGAALRTPFGPAGLFLLAAVLGFTLTVAMMWRQKTRAGTTEGEQEPWNPAMPTLAPRGEVDPRTE